MLHGTLWSDVGRGKGVHLGNQACVPGLHVTNTANMHGWVALTSPHTA
jgi:hypothetical protein